MATEQLINCLTDERVTVRFVPRENAMAGNNPRHAVYGGMADTSTRTYVVPQLRSGQLVDVLTKAEKAFLESYMGMEDNALSVHRTEKNFWKNFKVILHKHDNILDLSQPLDYIKYKVLKANTSLIAPDQKTLQDFPEATFEFVLIKDSDNLNAGILKKDAKKKAYAIFGKIEDDKYTMRVIVETLTRRPVADTTSTESLALEVDKLIDNNVKDFLRVAEDPLLPTKVLIRNGIEAGIIANRDGRLYLRDAGGDTPLCNNGEPTMSVAATFLNEPRHNETKLLIEAKVNQYKESVK